ncbi:MAG: oxygen-dependent coproporphyrinogen oxidase [Rhodospirillaceae bacterium]
MSTDDQKTLTANWFKSLRDRICSAFEEIENAEGLSTSLPGRFEKKIWERTDHSGAPGGGGEMSLMTGRVFEKVGVNISTVYGEFAPDFRKEIPGADSDPSFWASGISVVAHMCSPLVPAVHMNTRFIVTRKAWFGGGMDLTPMYPDPESEGYFHSQIKACCDRYSTDYYKKFKEWCDEYFYLPHRKEARGAGGIFYDYLDSGKWEDDFSFTRDVGNTFLATYPEIVRAKMVLPWTIQQRNHQLVRRGRYVEFNLLYDRGTKFGLQTGGNTEAILMSMPPEAKWT